MSRLTVIQSGSSRRNARPRPSLLLKPGYAVRANRWLGGPRRIQWFFATQYIRPQLWWLFGLRDPGTLIRSRFRLHKSRQSALHLGSCQIGRESGFDVPSSLGAESAKYPGTNLYNSKPRALRLSSPINLGSCDKLSFLITPSATSSDLSNSTWVSIAPIDCIDASSEIVGLNKLDLACLSQQRYRRSILWWGPQKENAAKSPAK